MSGGSSAEFWVNQDLETGVPTIANISLQNGSEDFRFGPLHVTSGTPLGGVYLYDGANLSTGNVTGVEVRNLTAEFGIFLENEDVKKFLLAEAKKKVAAAKAAQAALLALFGDAVAAENRAKKKAKKKRISKLKKKARKAKKAVNAARTGILINLANIDARSAALELAQAQLDAVGYPWPLN